MTDSYRALLGTKGGPSVRPGSTMPTSSLLCLDGVWWWWIAPRGDARAGRPGHEA